MSTEITENKTTAWEATLESFQGQEEEEEEEEDDDDDDADIQAPCYHFKMTYL